MSTNIYINITKAAHLVGLSTNQLRAFVRAGKLKPVFNYKNTKVGGGRTPTIFLRSDIEKLQQERGSV